jgi:hypothetical protein
MFDGTDLSLAYSGGYEAPMSTPIYQTPSNSQQQLPPPAISEPVIPKATASHATAPDQMYAPPPAMYAQQSASPSVSMPPTESFWERMADKKWEVLKLIALALVVVLGIAVDRVVNHYLTNYMSQAFLTAMQEFLLRIGYPVAIILVLWLMKTLA